MAVPFLKNKSDVGKDCVKLCMYESRPAYNEDTPTPVLSFFFFFFKFHTSYSNFLAERLHLQKSFTPVIPHCTLSHISHLETDTFINMFICIEVSVCGWRNVHEMAA